MESSAVAMKIEIRKMVPVDDATAFRTLIEDWITKIFSRESKDVEILGHPEQTIVDKGGRVFVVSADGEAVGCVALIQIKDDIYSRSSNARKLRKARTSSSQSWDRSRDVTIAGYKRLAKAEYIVPPNRDLRVANFSIRSTPASRNN
jgi:hypothetical protein